MRWVGSKARSRRRGPRKQAKKPATEEARRERAGGAVRIFFLGGRGRATGLPIDKRAGRSNSPLRRPLLLPPVLGLDDAWINARAHHRGFPASGNFRIPSCEDFLGFPRLNEEIAGLRGRGRRSCTAAARPDKLHRGGLSLWGRTWKRRGLAGKGKSSRRGDAHCKGVLYGIGGGIWEGAPGH
jgi:hypothetical protein